MPLKLLWTDSRDTRIRRLRHEGASWDAIAAELGTSRNAVLERGRRIGARLPPPPSPPDPSMDLLDSGREPLPPGHPVSWDAITAGTSLAGQPYPWPPFAWDNRRRAADDNVEAPSQQDAGSPADAESERRLPAAA